MPASARDFAPLSIEQHDDGLVVLSFVVADHGPDVPALLADLAAALDELDRGPRPKALVVRPAGAGSFFGGVDTDQLDALRTQPAAAIERRCDTERTLFARLSVAPWPSVAVIDGVCLGGGLELALACDLRVATDDPRTVLGFPDVKLGVLPGRGGTVRLARLIGPGPAVEFVAAGESIAAAAAARLGLVDACVPVEAALETARRLVEMRSATGAVAARRRDMAAQVPLDPAEREFLAATALAVIQGRTGGHYPAPPAILRAILDGAAVDAVAAGRIESAAFAALVRTPVAANLMRVFRIGQRNRHDPGVASAALVAPPSTPAVVGAGIMGAGIAAAHLRSGFPVTLVDIDPEALAASVPGILEEAAWDHASRRTNAARALGLAGSLRTAVGLAAVAAADIVLESVTERPDVKQQVLADIERTVAADAIVCTNTSTNPIARLAAGLARPERFCGLHFFNPVRRMTLVEVVRGPATADATVAAAVAHAKRLGKCPIVVRDSPGFLVNRVLMPYLHEATELMREGVDPVRIDCVARDFGMPLGPIELYDMIGLDTAFYAGLVLSAAFGERIEASPLVPALVKAGRLGRKTGAGFYRYASAGPRARIVGVDAESRVALDRYALPPRDASADTIADRLLLPMLLESLRTLDEGIVRDGRDVDLAVIHALGFPAFRGGLLAWADTLGADAILRRLEPLAELGPRMLPSPGLLDVARSGGRFIDLAGAPGGSAA
ncbi:MAG: 3-hydroxyacyl-CoA dehydrogenase NAD-binding domain-containing protein [Planctomycetaceae bacterium]